MAHTKRGRSKKAEDEEDASDPQEPPTKKPKSAVKRGKVATKDLDLEVPAAKKAKDTTKGKKAKGEEGAVNDGIASDNGAKAPIKRTRKGAGEIVDNESNEEAAPPKKTRGKKQTTEISEDLASADEVEAAPAPKSKRGRKKAVDAQVRSSSHHATSSNALPIGGRCSGHQEVNWPLLCFARC